LVALAVAVGYLLKAVRELRREARGLAREAEELLVELDSTVRRAGLEVERVDRMVGSAEVISEAVGSASKLVGGAVAGPLIKLVAFGAGLGRAARLVRRGPPARKDATVTAKEGRRRTRPRTKAKGTGRLAARSPGRDRASRGVASNSVASNNGLVARTTKTAKGRAG
jgi:hypothetical protein